MKISMIQFSLKSLKTKISLLLVGLGILCALGSGIVMYLRYNNYVKQTYTETLTKVLTMIEKQYPVFFDFEQVMKDYEVISDAYWEIVQGLNAALTSFNLAYLYFVEMKNGEYTILTAADVIPIENYEVTPYGKPDDALVAAYHTKTIQITKHPVTNEWGTLVSAFFPVVKNGEVVGILGADYDISFVKTLNRQVQLELLFTLLVSAAGAGILAFSLASLNITQPLEKLIRLVKGISQGNMDNTISVSGSDEIAELGLVFNKMAGDIKNHIKNIEQITMEKERINSELSIAAGIQTAMLPRITPAFTNHALFSLYAKMTPAKEVGGDFYDFFFLDETQTKIALVIADVSGKGVPAALFMAISKSLIKQQMLQNPHPAETLFKVNTILAEDNPQCMFVTVFLMVMDLATGQVEYANGGHNEPLLSQSGGAFCFLPLKKGLPLGIMEQGAYIPCRLTLNPGDRLYLYTDGINEAMNPQNQQFGNPRFLEAANQNRDLDVEAFDKGIRRSVADFIEGAAQSDDITSLCLTFNKRAEL